MTPPPAPLHPRHRAVLQALCRRMVPLDDGEAVAAAADAVAARIGELPEADAAAMGRVLSLFGSRVAGLAGAGVPRGFAALPPARQDAWLRRWEASRVPLLRTAFQAVRRLVLGTYYARPEAAAEIGWTPPPGARAEAFPWEGPLPADGAAGPTDSPRRRARRTRPQLDLLADPALTGVVEGGRLRGDQRLHADVCVIGSGPGGAVAAARLAEAGHEVVVLEEGGYWQARDLPGGEAEAYARLYAEGGTRATADLAVTLLQGRAVGGSSIVNWLAMLRAPDHVLEAWAREHGTVGMGPAELAPVFSRVEAETRARLVPEDAHSPANRLLLEGSRRLGWRAAAVRVNAEGCLRCGGCGLGCGHGARRSAGEVYVPAAVARGVRIFSDVRAERIEVRERGSREPRKRVVATVLDRETGAPRGALTVDAPVVVVAAGAVGTPLLLQRSGMGGGGVGRYLRLHPTTVVAGLHESEVHQGTGLPLTVVNDEFVRGEDGFGFVVETPPVYPAMAAAVLQGFGAEHRARMEALTRSAAMIVIVRDGADDAAGYGRVSAGADGRPKIRYRLTAADRRRLVQGIEAAARIQFAAGAVEVTTAHAPVLRLGGVEEVGRIAGCRAGPNQVGVASAHVNGTCRIGTDPATSGCTPDGERHGAAGVYVTDGSLFPTGLGVNPQETIMALATVVAGRIAARHPPGRAGSAGGLAGVGR